MREIIRPDVLWREVIPLAVFLAVVLLVLFVALINEDDLAGKNLAVATTMHLAGGVIAMVSAFGLFWRALNGQPLELQFGFVLALLAGLLLVHVHWSLAIALAVIGIALIVRQIMRPESSASPADRPIP